MANLKSQKFTVDPQGLIKSGNATYQADLDSGNINCQGAVVVGKWVFAKSCPFSVSYKVDPSILLSAGKTPGKVFKIGDLNLQVVSIDQKIAICHLTIVVKGEAINGMARFDLSKPYIQLRSITASGKFMGIDATAIVKEDLT